MGMAATTLNRKLDAWIFLLAMGCGLIGIGGYAFIRPLHAYYYLVKFGGVFLLVHAIFLLLSYYSLGDSPKEKRWILLESIADFIFGLALMANPLFSFMVFPFLIGPWILCVGLLKTLASFNLKTAIRGWAYILCLGLLSIGFGILVLFNPFSTSNGITRLMGAFGLTLGSLDIIDAMRFRKSKDTLDMMV